VGWRERIEKAPKVVVVCALQPDSGEKFRLADSMVIPPPEDIGHPIELFPEH